MNRSVEPALTSLIPRYNGPLPPELIELAGSLLTLSRTKASNLKAEEEIGRTYACANIACERLKQSLNLPKIEPHPPCPPRTYNKLYKYLDGLLVIRKRGRPPKTTSSASTPAKPLPSRPIPTKASSLAAYKPSSPSRRRTLLSSSTTADIPSWIHPTIRGLTKTLSAPAAAPHILAGVSSILTLPRPNPQKAQKEALQDCIPALIAAVYFFVYTRLSGRETSGKQYVAQRKAVLQLLWELREDVEIGEKVRRKRGDGEIEWEGWEGVGTKDVDDWLLEISSGGWLGLDWFENIVEGEGVDVADGEGRADLGEVGEEEEEEGIRGERGMGSMGLDSMMQDRVDYLSERKRAEYRVWKQNVLSRIEEMEAAM